MNNLKKLRLEQGITQENIAERLGLTSRGYRYIENGNFQPSYRSIKALEDYFKKTIDYLLAQVDDGSSIGA